MKVVTPFEVADCNTELLCAGVPCRVHLTDACGAQSFWLEAEKERLDGPVPTLRCSNERK